MVTSDIPHTQSFASTKPTAEKLRATVLPANIQAQTEQEQRVEIAQAVEKLVDVPEQVRTKIGKTMYPRTYALEHPASSLLEHYAENGCPVDCGQDWPVEWIEEALRRGPHISAKNPLAIEALRKETLEKIENGYARMIKWKELKKNLPRRLKISPVAAIPHKSRLFRTILDLSFRLKYNGARLPSVNSATVKQAPAEAMVQLGECVKRIVSIMAENYNLDKPFVFAKIDIKDGFWRMAVSNEDAWNFCYVMPSLENSDNIDKAEIIVPNSLQMGWAESPPYFCADVVRRGTAPTTCVTTQLRGTDDGKK